MSLVEANTNVVVGFLLALLTQFTIFPVFGLVVSVAHNLLISSIFSGVTSAEFHAAPDVRRFARVANTYAFGER